MDLPIKKNLFQKLLGVTFLMSVHCILEGCGKDATIVDFVGTIIV